MRRIALWALSTIAATVLLFGYSTSTAGPLAAIGPVPAGTPKTGTGGKASIGTSKPNAPVPVPDPAKGAITTVDGASASTRWGPVQVELQLQNGRIVGVKLLKQPSGNAMDTFIGTRALPVLINATVDSQGKHVDMVSGATFTSGGYLTSLQSALDGAGL